MRINQINKLNLKKSKFYKVKSLYLVIPLTTLVALSIIVASQAKNIKAASDKSIFGTIEDQATLIEIVKDSPSTFGGRGGNFSISSSGFSNTFNSSDLTKIKSIAGVSDADINSQVPVGRAITTDLFSDKNLSISSLVGINDTMADLYTSEDFNYKEGEPIPIILNSNTLIETYEDWGDKTEITVEIGQPGENNPGDLMASSPIKSSAIDFDKSDIIGKEFTINFGGLEDIQDYEQSFTEAGITFTKLTAEELASRQTTQKTDISKYWNYDKISTHLTYTFKVVGVIDSETSFSNYIPKSFASKVMNDLIANQLAARNTTAISSSDLNTLYKGLTYDGVELKSAGFGFAGIRMIRFGGPGGASVSASEDSDWQAEYTIPGLIIETERSQGGDNPFASGGDVIGEYKDSAIYDNVAKTGSTLLVRIQDIYSRDSVVKALNDEGYAYVDKSDTEVFAKVRDTVATINLIVVVGFIALSAAFILLTMGKFVSESKKEIGVLRAIGATKTDIKKLFLFQSLGYVFISYLIGGLVGFGGTILLSGLVKGIFDSFVGDTIKESFNVVNESSVSDFTKIDFQIVGIFSLSLLLIAIITSLVPAIRASRVSPVVAIKGE